MATQQGATIRAPRSVHALNRLMEIMIGFIDAQVFMTACNLGVFEGLADQPRTADELAQRLQIHPVGCRRLLMALTGLRLLTRDGDRFANSELGSYCTTHSAVNFSALSGFGSPFYHMFEYLPDALREYSPRWQQALGATSDDVFEAMYSDPRSLQDFARFMNALSIPQGQLIAEVFDFSPYKCLMDIAGGPGGQSVQIGLKNPGLRGIICDVPPVCAIAEEYIAKAGLTDRFAATPTDLFRGPYPSGADVILLGHVLHDWSDEKCAVILRHCADALPSRGVLLISETVLGRDFSSTRFELMKDLTMLVACESGARERTEAEFNGLLSATGFEFDRVIALDAPRDLLVAHKP